MEDDTSRCIFHGARTEALNRGKGPGPALLCFAAGFGAIYGSLDAPLSSSGEYGLCWVNTPARLLRNLRRPLDY